MSESDTDASTGESSARRYSKRIVQKPNRFIDDLERAAATPIQPDAPRNPKFKRIPANNATPETPNAITDATLRNILKKINLQDTEIRKLQTALQARDEKLEEQEKNHQEQITTLQNRINNLNSQIESYQIDELKKTVKEIHETTSTGTNTSTPPGIQTPSNGRTWASQLTASSVISPATRATTTALTLPNIIIQVRNAAEDIKQKLADGAIAKSTIQQALKNNQDTEQVRIEGVKVTAGSNVRVFLASQEDAHKVREHQKWLEAFEGARLNGEPWFPIKIDSVRKTDVFDKKGDVREDFYNSFKEENSAEIRRIHWLSGPKAYGSMVTFLSQESDMTRLLHQKFVQISGEISFTSEYHYIQRPMRCRNCQSYGHKQARCKTTTICEKCAGPHQKHECTEAQEKCGACGGAHQASDQQCPRWVEEINRIRDRRQGNTPSRGV